MLPSKYALLGVVLALVPFGIQAQAIKFPGTISDYKKIDTAKLLTRMNTGDGRFIAVAAHRGYWQTAPENSILSVTSAFDAGIGAVEIDVRLASTLQSGWFTAGIRADPTGDLVLSHDECIDRETTGSGSLRGHLAAYKSNCLPLAPSSPSTIPDDGLSLATFKSKHLRDRTGKDVGYGPPSFEDVLTAFKSYLSVDSGVLHGPVLVIDLKDKDDIAPVAGQCSECLAWNEYLYGLTIVNRILDDPKMRPAVVWKIKMAAALPSATAIGTQINATDVNSGHVVLTINPEDVNNTTNVAADMPQPGQPSQPGYGPNGNSFQTLLAYAVQSVPYVAQFEYVPFNARDGSSLYLTADGLHERRMSSFATYYQPSFYPEGVATRFATCCYLAPLNQAETGPNGTLPQIDTRGILDFATYYNTFFTGLTPGPQTTTITSDNLLETMNYLVANGYRTLSEIQ